MSAINTDVFDVTHLNTRKYVNSENAAQVAFRRILSTVIAC